MSEYQPTADEAATIFEHSSDGIIVLSGRGTIRYANPQAERLFRQKAESLEGLDFWTMAGDARTAEAAETLERALHRKLGGRFEIFHPGLYAWHAVTVAPSKGGAVLYIRDVTDRMRMLRDEAVQQRIAEVIGNIPVAISITRGPEHRFEIVNAFARKLLGGKDVVGQTIRNAFPELAAQGFVDLFDKVYATGEVYRARNMVASFRRGAEEELSQGVFDVVYQPVRDMNGEINGVLSLSVEVRPDEGQRVSLDAD